MITKVASGQVDFSASSANRQFTMPTVKDGDFLVAQAVLPSGTATITGPSTIAGIVESAPQTYSGHRHTLWTKENLQAATHSGVTALFTASASYKWSLAWAIFRGVPAASVIDVLVGANGPTGGSATMTSPTGATIAVGDVELQFVAGTGSAGNTTFTVPPGMTVLQELHDPTVQGGAGGTTHAVMAWNTSALPANTSIGNDSWGLSGSNPVLNNLLSAFTVAIKATAVATTVRPSGTVTSTGFVVTGAATVHAATADESDATYVESGENPAGTQYIEVNVPEIDSGPITISGRAQQFGAAPQESIKLSLRQGTTLIAERTFQLTTAFATYSFTTTTQETALITDRTALRLRVVPTTGA